MLYLRRPLRWGGKHSCVRVRVVSVVLGNFRNIKTRLFAPYGVANPRDSQRYHGGLLLVWPKNPSFLFVPEIAKHYTSDATRIAAQATLKKALCRECRVRLQRTGEAGINHYVCPRKTCMSIPTLADGCIKRASHDAGRRCAQKAVRGARARDCCARRRADQAGSACNAPGTGP